ncbi:hypothetical protein FACS189464_1130 [Bacteroidia bacterium]|nr:hypothetical protein FACS189464_1130 [Bacteroidia bacterium]
MKSSILKQFAVVAIACVAAVSCKDNDIVYDTDFKDKALRTVNFAAPIAKVHIPIYKSIEKWMDLDGLSYDEKTGIIQVSFTHTQNVDWTNDIGVDELNKRFEYPLPSFPQIPGIGPLPGTYSWTKEGLEKITLTTNEADNDTRIDAVTFKNGQLDFDIALPSSLTGKLVIEIPELTTNGVPFKIEKDLVSGNNPISNSLSNGRIETANSQITINYAITVTYSGATLPAGKVVLDVRLDINGDDLTGMFGYFGKIETEAEDNDVSFDFFENLDLKQDIGLKDITIKADIINNVGLPMALEVESIKMYKDDTDLGKALTVTPEFKFDNVASALYENGQVTSVTTHKEVTADIAFSGGNYPNKLRFEITGKGNPNGVTATSNFLVKSDKNLVDVNLEILVPLHFKTGLYERQDTIGFDFNEMIDDDVNMSKSIEEVVLNLDINNGLPFEIELSGEAIDDNGKNIVTLIPIQKINSGTPDVASGKVTPAHTNFEVKIEQAQIELLRSKGAKKIILITKSATYNEGNDYVKIHHDAALDVDVSLSFTSNIPSSIF